MGFYSGYLLLSDIDGTLTREGDEISPENLRALHHFMDEGGYFTLATGRNVSFLADFGIQPNIPLVAINGTLVVSKQGERLMILPMEEDSADVVRYFLARHPGITGLMRSEENQSPWWIRDKDGDICTVLHGDAPCLRYYFTCDSEPTALALLADATEHFGDRFEFNRSWPDGMEMHIKGSGKDAGLRFLRDYLPGVHTTISVGNYENDMPMLRAADIGCAVENALPHVKAAADQVIVSHMDHALAYIIETLIPSLAKNI